MIKKQNKPRKAIVENYITFGGVSELAKAGKDTVLHIYCSFEDAVGQGVPREIAAVVFAGKLGAKPGGCINLKNRPLGSFDCRPAGCTGTCHVFSFPRGPVPINPEPTDEGFGPVTMVAGRFYWCSCT
jgi:hypothetical protein